jgi:hypothetical protein
MLIGEYYIGSLKMAYTVDWIHLVQDSDHWRAPLNTVLNLGSHKMLHIFEWLSNCWLLKKGSAPMS